MKSSLSVARWSAVSLAVGTLCPAFSQTTLPEVVITATRFEEPAKGAPYAVSVITADDLRASGASSVSEALARMLGVPGRLDTSGGGNYTMDLRGFGSTADRNQVVVVDGRRLKDDDLSATNLSVIPIETVERIEVLRGSGTVQYGEGATGGVIVITTKSGKGLQQQNSATVGATVGSFDTREVRTSAVLASGGFLVDVAAKDFKTNGHRQNFASTVNNLSSTLQWSGDDLRVGLSTGRQLMQSGWPGSLTAAQYAADPSQASSLINFGTAKTEYAGVFAQYLVGDWEFGWDTNSRSKVSRSRTWGIDVSAMNTNVRARHEYTTDAVSNAFTVGVDTMQWSGQDINAVLSDSQSSALYLTDDVTLSPTKTRFSVGVRTEADTKKRSSSNVRVDERPLAWHAGVNQELAPSWAVYGRVGSSYRLPTADEFTYVLSGVVLQMQTSKDFETGLRWMEGADKVEIRYYRNELTNELGFDPVVNGGNGANVNFDPSRRQGIELEVRRAMTKTLDARANVAWREAKYVAGTYAGNDVALVPRQTASFGANWRPAAGHSVDGVLTWVSSQSPTFTNQCEMPAYTTMDARYAYQTTRWELALGVKNLADAKYYTQAFRCTGGVTASIYPEAGRAFTASAQWRF
ncbi:TonB-dependent receptor [Curvibacter sp. APW13]|uniref:TonB-dependent receptor n=1 Tax=Curvibacter sp. APW13 TaxID=3077236 RepID=UPI0028E09D00|nr:TonB-dependent receptor [Curvibacter sp. APW13]MDT8991777.1 TonB-dependent receptor [Curvibacter sp. APW13]